MARLGNTPLICFDQCNLNELFCSCRVDTWIEQSASSDHAVRCFKHRDMESAKKKREMACQYAVAKTASPERWTPGMMASRNPCHYLAATRRSKIPTPSLRAKWNPSRELHNDFDYTTSGIENEIEEQLSQSMASVVLHEDSRERLKFPSQQSSSMTAGGRTASSGQRLKQAKHVNQVPEVPKKRKVKTSK